MRAIKFQSSNKEYLIDNKHIFIMTPLKRMNLKYKNLVIKVLLIKEPKER